jgi:hypothetical protein
MLTYMARVELTAESLLIHVEGMDQIWALKSQLEIPLQHVLDAEADVEIARGWWHGIRWPGTNLPGVLTAGTFYKDGQRVFWDIHHPEMTVVISLVGEDYNKLVIEVENPTETVRVIKGAVAAVRSRTGAS